MQSKPGDTRDDSDHARKEANKRPVAGVGGRQGLCEQWHGGSNGYWGMANCEGSYAADPSPFIRFLSRQSASGLIDGVPEL